VNTIDKEKARIFLQDDKELINFDFIRSKFYILSPHTPVWNCCESKFARPFLDNSRILFDDVRDDDLSTILSKTKLIFILGVIKSNFIENIIKNDDLYRIYIDFDIFVWTMIF
jgi:hypothetical protein